MTLTQKQLERIPYLRALVSHADNLNCRRNKDNSFVLDDYFSYDVCYPIFSFVIHKQSSCLFTELPRHSNLLRMLEIYDYFCMKSLPVPSIKALLDMFYEEVSIFSSRYKMVIASEQRETASQFLIAIANGKYDMDNLEIAKIIFYVLIDILSHADVFDPRLRYHTLIIIENFCRNLFTEEQQALLLAYKRSLQEFSDTNLDPSMLNKHIIGWKKFSFCDRSTRAPYLAGLLIPRVLNYSVNKWSVYGFLFCCWCPLLRDQRRKLSSCQCLVPNLECESCKRYAKVHAKECYGVDVSCPCGFLDKYTREYWTEDQWRDLVFGRDPFRERRSHMEGPITKFKMCLLKCCTSSDHRRKQLERKKKYSDRQSHWIPPPAVDRFKNRPTNKKSKNRQ